MPNATRLTAVKRAFFIFSFSNSIFDFQIAARFHASQSEVGSDLLTQSAANYRHRKTTSGAEILKMQLRDAEIRQNAT
jgi:hypothetical protein